MINLSASFFDYSEYMPHGMCYLWRPEIVWTSAISDIVTTCAYFSFATAVIYFVRQRKDLPYPWFFILAGSIVFIACGSSHFLSAVVIWEPMYGYLSAVKLVVAVSSVAAGVLIWKILPICLLIPSPAMLEIKNKSLQDEIETRIRIEEQLRKTNNELMQARNEADQANRARSQFLSMMSHEIRTPMNGVIGVAELMDHTELDSEQKKYIRIMHRSGNTLMTVINDILDYSKIEAGKLTLEFIPFNLSSLIEETVLPYDSRDNLAVKLTVAIDKTVPLQLIGDPIRLHQILNNLISNALKFTHEGSVNIHVAAELGEKDRSIMNFSVTDTGIGISEEEQQILFRPFSQAAPSTARKYGGTGLGLSICKRLVDMMDGEISVHSEQGRGSNFVCRIPLLINDEAGHEEESTFGDEDYSQMRILLVEDNATNRIVIKALINKLGVNVDIAADGEKAIELVCNKQRQFDLILMDCEMPRLDGYQTTEIIRRWEADQGQSATAIFALSAHVMSEHIKKCEAAGMDEHLSKPISLNQLRKAFNHVRSAS